jgi:hypothetical protein
MKNILMAFVAIVSFLNITRAQNQLENPGFEEWEDVLIGATDTIREPLNWSSLKTSDDVNLNPLAPVVCKRSNQAHTGSYSVQLTNILTLLVANGTVTNGRVHPNLLTSLAYMYTDTIDERWNTPFTGRPDSITGWFKYLPQPSDTLEVLAVLHRGYGKQPDANYLNNWIAQAHFRSGINSGSQWVRFSAPFIYFSDQTPQYALVILNSGNGFTPVAGSIAWFDDLQMNYNSNPAPALEHAVPAEFIYTLDNQTIVLKTDQPEPYTMASITDITGRLVWKGPVSSDHIDISSAGLKKGIYLILLTGRNIRFTSKIMVH